MADGSMLKEALKRVLEEAVQNKLVLNDLRRQVAAWISERGGRPISTDRHDGVIKVLFYSSEGEYLPVSVPETKMYQEKVSETTW